MSKDVNIHIKTPGAREAKQQLDEFGREVDSVGKKTDAAGRKGGEGFDKLDQGAKKAKGGFSSLRGGATLLITKISAVIGAAGLLIGKFTEWYDAVKKISEAQKELVESTKSLDQASKSLAGQANLLGAPGGIAGARQQILQIQTAGNLPTFELAEAVAVSAHSAIGTTGQLLTPEQIGVAEAVAGFVQRKDIDAGGIDDLFKLLAKIGETTGRPVTKEYTQELIQKMSTVQQSSRVKSFKQFMPGAIKSMMTSLTYKGTVNMGLAQYASALDVQPTADLAASETNKVAALLLNPQIAKAIGGGFEGLPYDQQLEAFGAWVAANADTPEGKRRLMKAGITAEQMGVVTRLYNTEQLQRIQMFRGLGAGATAKQFKEEAEGYGGSIQGQIDAIEAGGLRKGANATPSERIGEAMQRAAEKEFTQKVAMGKEDKGVKDEIEIEKILMDSFRQRVKALKDARKDTSLIEAYLDEIYPTIDTPLPSLRAAKTVIKQAFPVIDASELTPEEIGEADLILKNMESRGGDITIYNNWEYHQDTNIQPRIAPDQGYPFDPNAPRAP